MGGELECRGRGEEQKEKSVSGVVEQAGEVEDEKTLGAGENWAFT